MGNKLFGVLEKDKKVRRKSPAPAANQEPQIKE